MSCKLTLCVVLLLGLLNLGSSHPSSQDDQSFAIDKEAAEALQEKVAKYFDEEEIREIEEEAKAYDQFEAELMSQFQETRRSQEGPPRLLKSSSFCSGKRDGNYADEANPRAFYMCDKAGQTWSMNCQASLVYDQTLNRCEWAHNRGYQQAPITPLPPLPPHAHKKCPYKCA